ncbi:poly-gamma-glutamate hydrolase family protein [Streptomyces sp. NPDC091371]|uniref:poly-gamma-glutamate hydrolase family protein n=1 Tax=Streptomyces sp. NPDC091371 TaxID=3155303 RepID=UPI003448CB92
MKITSRRAVLTSVAAAAATLPLLNDLAGNGGTAAAAETSEPVVTNAVLYSDPQFQEGVDWMRRFRCGPAGTELLDNASGTSQPVRSTAIIAPHGGAIEQGTSELCLAIAGYKPAAASTTQLPAAEEGQLQRDYWMFEALKNISKLHVTSALCDDPAALAVCGNNLYAVSLHGFAPDVPAISPTPPDFLHRQILIGGRDQRLMRTLARAFADQGFTRDNSDPAKRVEVILAGANSPLNGDDPANIVNRTRTGAGAQLEISTELRKAMFGNWDTAADRRTTYGAAGAPAFFWNGFVNAVRHAIDRHEKGYADAPASQA